MGNLTTLSRSQESSHTMQANYNNVTFGKEARDGLSRGIDTLYRAVSSTLGARSRTVGIDYGFAGKILKDGVSIAKVIALKDPVENFGAQRVAEAARKTVQDVGDGTTVTIILAHAIITEAQKLIEAGVSPMELTEGLEKGVQALTDEIGKYATPAKKLQEVIDVATVSVSGDKPLGKLIGETIHKVGLEGVVTVEENTKSNDTYVDHQEGMRFAKGYSHQLFITNPDKMEASLKDTKVLVTDKQLNPSEILPLFTEVFEKRGMPLVILSPESSEQLRDFLVVNKMQGKIRALHINQPDTNLLQDIAILTGARFISTGDTWDKVVYADLGKAKRITSSATTTEVVGGGGSKEALETRVSSLVTQIKQTDSDFEKEKLRERYAKLTDGIAVINVGGRTEVEMQERKERVDDAVGATMAAIDEGIVPGGEIVYLSALRALKGDSYANTILRNALKAPFRKLMTNAGFDGGQMLEKINGTVVVAGVEGFGIDVTTGKLENMLAIGVIDPVAVPKAALRNALSVAIQIISCDTVITPHVTEGKK